MNIFAVHDHPLIAARMLCDKHIVKMPTETAQMLSAVWCDVSERPALAYPPNKKVRNHICTRWVAASTENYAWLVAHGREMVEEHGRRYPQSPLHRALVVLDSLRHPPATVPSGPLAPFAQAMPPQYRGPDAIDAYRAYYIGEKLYMARWKTGQKPYWVPE